MRLSLLYKQLDRRAEAIGLWEAVAQAEPLDPLSASEACIELAKYYEWHAIDLQQAIAWTSRASDLTVSLSDRFVREERLAEAQHRLARLQKKLARAK